MSRCRKSASATRGPTAAGLAGFRWSAAAQPKAVLQLAHGAGEHSGRYREPLAPLVEAGYLIYAADHRGHGLTSGMASLGDFGPGGAPAAVDDMAILSRRARAENPDLPLILMGHSMGAMFSQAYVLDAFRPDRCAGAVGHGRAGSATRRRPEQRLRQPAHRLRLAEPRRGRGRQIHRRPVLRHPLRAGVGRLLHGAARARRRPRGAGQGEEGLARLRLRRRRGPDQPEARAADAAWSTPIAPPGST